jgi:RimJ/RimL family protein N-acetyltransferase
MTMTESLKGVVTVPIRYRGRQVGHITVRDSGRDQMGYIEWFIRPEYRGLGYAAGAIKPMLPDLLVAWHRLVAVIRPNNEASIAVAHAIGMRHECPAVRSRFIDERWEDTEFFAITSEEVES